MHLELRAVKTAIVWRLKELEEKQLSFPAPSRFLGCVACLVTREVV